jgi:MFS family permease
MVAVSFVAVALGFGLLLNISVFLKPLVDEFGWPRGEIAFAYTAGSLVAGFGGVAAGWLTDRHGARPVVLIGAVTTGFAFLLLSRLTSLWSLYLGYCALGGFGYAAVSTPLLASVGQWFTQNKGLAIGIVTAGGTSGMAVVPYLAGRLIDGLGWRHAYTGLAVLSWAALVPVAFLVRRAPALGESGQAAGVPGEDSFPVEPSIVVAWISTAVVFCCTCMATPMVHVVALVSDRGFDPQTAAGVLSAIMIAGVFGRIATGKVADRIGGLHAYILASAAQTVLVFWFTQLGSLAGLYVLAVLFGLGYSGVMTCIVVCVREMTPLQRNGVSLGIVSLFAWVGMGLGGWQGGFFFDLTGAYTVSYGNAALAGVVNLIILESLRRYIKQRYFRLQSQTA